MDYSRIKSIVAGTKGLAGWYLRRVETDATTVIRLPGIYTHDGTRFVHHANPHPREVINAPSEEVWVTVYARHPREASAGQESATQPPDPSTPRPLSDEQMGEAIGQFVSDEETQVRETLAVLAAAASGQPNKPYPFTDAGFVFPKVELADPALSEASRPELVARVQQFSDAVLAAAAAEADIEVSNLEVFVKRIRTRLDTSSGLALEFPSTRADAEVCFIARFGDKEAEHTVRPHARRIADLDPKGLVADGAASARGIAQAGPAPQFSGPVILTGDAAHDFMKLDLQPLSMHCAARAVFEKFSRYEKGKPVWGDKPLKGEAVTLYSDPLVPFGPESRIESEAQPTRRVCLLNDGCYDELLGNLRYYHYLGLLGQGAKPAGTLGNTVVSPGRTKAADLAGGEKTVVVRSFSDFRADPASGDFAAEIRLGEVRDKATETPFKGGLLIGNWFDALADVRLSSETMASDGYCGPSAVRVGNLTVAG
jgi:predicted Zn-dependent protease